MLIPEFKTCTKCCIPKPIKRFRKRTKFKNSVAYAYIQKKCMDCECKEQKERYHKNIEIHRERNRSRARKYYNENKDILNEIKRDLRKEKNNPILLYQREYNKKNKDKIAKQHKIVAKRFQEKIRDNLSDSYVIQHIIQRTSLKREDIEKYPEMIEAYRQQMKINRIIKNKKSCHKKEKK